MNISLFLAFPFRLDHSHTLQKYKDRMVDAIKYNNGNMQLVVATSASSMDVNFPDVGYVVHAGPPRALVDHIECKKGW